LCPGTFCHPPSVFCLLPSAFPLALRCAWRDTQGMDPGLCKTCRHVKQLTSSRGSVFFMCTLADAKPEFPRYPQLPVMRCAGHELPPGKTSRK